MAAGPRWCVFSSAGMLGGVFSAWKMAHFLLISVVAPAPLAPMSMPEHPSTGQRVEVLWDVPAVWSVAEVSAFEPETGQHSVTYDSNFKHTSQLRPHRWKFLEQPAAGTHDAAKHLAAQEEGGAEFGTQLVGRSVRVLWDRLTEWQQFVVGQCDVHRGVVGICSVHRLEDGPSFRYN